MGLATMPDRKFERDYDRQITLDDIKRRLIVLMDNGQELPEEDIYDEPVRYYKLNLKWAPIIFGWVDWLEDPAGWKAAEDDNFSGIQQVLKFEEGIEIMTPQETQTAITEGIYKAVNDVAKQIVSGARGGFAVDENGNVTTGGTAEEPPPEDDPTTIIDESKAALAGAFLSVAAGVTNFFEDLEELYGPADGTAATPLGDAQFIIRNKYIVNDTMDNQILLFYVERDTSIDTIDAFSEIGLAGYLYCHSENTIANNIRAFLASYLGIPVISKARMIDLLSGLADEQFTVWYQAGIRVPASQYADFSCEPIPDETFTVNWNAVHTTNGIQKKNHRYLVHSSGVLTDPDGDIQDTWYYKPSGGDPVFSANHMNVTSTGFTADPTAAQVPYRADHVYEWTYDRDDNHTVDFNPSRNAGMNVASTGNLTITVKDLGEFLA